MRRHCDGNDENLTREVPVDQIDLATMTQSRTWRMMAQPGFIVIRCQCGLRFDDKNRLVTYPHEAF